MNNDVVAPEPGAEEVVAINVERAETPLRIPPVADTENAPSPPAARSVAGEMRKMFHWIAIR